MAPWCGPSCAHSLPTTPVEIPSPSAGLTTTASASGPFQGYLVHEGQRRSRSQHRSSNVNVPALVQGPVRECLTLSMRFHPFRNLRRTAIPRSQPEVAHTLWLTICWRGHCIRRRPVAAAPCPVLQKVCCGNQGGNVFISANVLVLSERVPRILQRERHFRRGRRLDQEPAVLCSEMAQALEHAVLQCQNVTCSESCSFAVSDALIGCWRRPCGPESNRFLRILKK